ncbi:MAG TPA: sulfatase-like hydrolase/transferase [Terriglobia bacterium]|nr:sulfatase-like hydrolase/transferase [Terriglobia bacterium]
MKSPKSISRRALIGGAAFGAAASGIRHAFPQTPSTSRPNIVFIMADDFGYADASCYGRRDFTTPNIDRIAANGIRFLQAYANSSVCSATRTALITGRYQYRLPIGLEEPLVPDRPSVGLPPTHPTLPSILKRAGYRTSLVGKWHLGVLPDFGPLQSGYDDFYGFRGGTIDYYAHTGTDHKEDLWENDTPIRVDGYSTGLLGARAVNAIDRYARSAQPFFLSLHFNAPHWPWEAPGDEAESERLRDKSLVSYDGGTQETYRRIVQAMDIEIGRVLDAIEANNLTRNTIVVFTSDNGGERFSDTWPFTGRKTELLEGGLRVPALVSWPDRLPRGRTSDQVTISMDWMPTLLAFAGAAPAAGFAPDGMSLLPHLTGNAAPVPRQLFWRYKANAQRAVRDGDYKFLKILDNTFLFNVVEDPMERANLKERRKDIYDRLETEWREWNQTMLPEIDESTTSNFTGSQMADHIGTPKTSLKADNPD